MKRIFKKLKSSLSSMAHDIRHFKSKDSSYSSSLPARLTPEHDHPFPSIVCLEERKVIDNKVCVQNLKEMIHRKTFSNTNSNDLQSFISVNSLASSTLDDLGQKSTFTMETATNYQVNTSSMVSVESISSKDLSACPAVTSTVVVPTDAATATSSSTSTGFSTSSSSRNSTTSTNVSIITSNTNHELLSKPATEYDKTEYTSLAVLSPTPKQNRLVFDGLGFQTTPIKITSTPIKPSVIEFNTSDELADNEAEDQDKKSEKATSDDDIFVDSQKPYHLQSGDCWLDLSSMRLSDVDMFYHNGDSDSDDNVISDDSEKIADLTHKKIIDDHKLGSPIKASFGTGAGDSDVINIPVSESKHCEVEDDEFDDEQLDSLFVDTDQSGRFSSIDSVFHEEEGFTADELDLVSEFDDLDDLEGYGNETVEIIYKRESEESLQCLYESLQDQVTERDEIIIRTVLKELEVELQPKINELMQLKMEYGELLKLLSKIPRYSKLILLHKSRYIQQDSKTIDQLISDRPSYTSLYELINSELIVSKVKGSTDPIKIGEFHKIKIDKPKDVKMITIQNDNIPPAQEQVFMNFNRNRRMYTIDEEMPSSVSTTPNNSRILEEQEDYIISHIAPVNQQEQQPQELKFNTAIKLTNYNSVSAIIDDEDDLTSEVIEILVAKKGYDRQVDSRLINEISTMELQLMEAQLKEKDFCELILAPNSQKNVSTMIMKFDEKKRRSFHPFLSVNKLMNEELLSAVRVELSLRI